MLLAYGMVCAVDSILGVPDYGVYPFEDLELIVLSAGTGNGRFMIAFGLLDPRKAVQAR